MINSYKKRILKYVKLILDMNRKYREILFTDTERFIKPFEKVVSKAKERGIVPLRFGMKQASIKKYFGDWDNFVIEVKMIMDKEK